jgi:hypothetical protein
MVVDKKNNDRFINYIIIKNMISNSLNDKRLICFSYCTFTWIGQLIQSLYSKCIQICLVTMTLN